MTRIGAIALVLLLAAGDALALGGWFGGEEERTPSEHPWAEGIGPASEEEIRALGVSDDLAEMLRNRTEGLPSLLRVPAEETPVGLVWPIASTKSTMLVRDLRDELERRGFVFFVARQRFGTGPDEVGLVEAAGVEAVLERLGTPGEEADLSTDDLVDRLASWREIAPWKLLGAGPDWVEVDFEAPPSGDGLARILDQASRLAPAAVAATGDERDALARQLERSGRLLLWWE